jgi:hypothetical protein
MLALKLSPATYYGHRLLTIEVHIDRGTNIARVMDVPYRNDIDVDNIETLLKFLAGEVGTRQKSTPIF